MEIANGEHPLRLLFSADIGPDAKLLQPDPQGPSGLDYVICEATYGDRDREATTDERRRTELRDEVRAAIHPNGALLIPSFAVERAQELIADLAELMTTDELPEIAVYVDSPLAEKATRVFARHAREFEGGDRLSQAIGSRHLRFTQTVEQSIALDRVHGFHIVIAASGMCEAGRKEPTEELDLARRGDGAARRLPGRGHARAYPAGWSAQRAHPRGHVRCPRAHPLRACESNGASHAGSVRLWSSLR